MKNEITIPPPHVNVMITYKGSVFVPDRYYGRYEQQVVTRRAFYSNSNGYYNSKDEWIETPDGYFSVPQFWRDFTFSDGTSALLPHTFYSLGRVFPKDIIKCEIES